MIGAVGHAGPLPGWIPASPCSPEGCLPDLPTGPAPVRVARRLGALIVVLLVMTVGVPLLTARARDRWLQAGSRAALAAAGVRLRVRGDERFRAGGGVLVVANHLSWIDVLALDAVQPVRMLAKREVRDWPVIGRLASRTGAVFIDRAGLRSLPATVATTAAALRDGAVIGVFPEGTTWCGAAAGPFRRAAFQAALDARAPVRPVAMVLRRPDGSPCRSGAFVGEQTLMDSLLRVVREPALVCELTLLPILSPAPGEARRELARRAAEAVAGVTGVRQGPPIAEPAPAVPDTAAA